MYLVTLPDNNRFSTNALVLIFKKKKKNLKIQTVILEQITNGFLSLLSVDMLYCGS